MADVVRFTSSATMDVPTQAVYLKDRWDSPWTAVPEIWCEEAAWNLAPTLPVAHLRYRYGEAFAAGDTAFASRFPLSRLRYYVRIDFSNFPLVSEDLDRTIRSWYGVIDAELDDQLGPLIAIEAGQAVAYPRGRNHWLAYGLEAILSQSWIDRSAIVSGEGVAFVGKALSFNPGLADYNPDPVETTGEGNRSAARVGASYVFAATRSGGQTWSTRTAVEYLLAQATARDFNGEQIVPFALEDADGALPDWDTPIERCEGRTVLDVLHSLIPRQRALGWRAEVRASDNGGRDRVAIVPSTFLAAAIVLEGQKQIAANPSQVILCWETDRGAAAAVRRAAQDQVDQVIARGEIRTSTASFSFTDSTLAIGWPAALETAYEQGASLDAGYPAAAEGADRQIRNIAARSADKFAPVYARFVPADPMGGYVGDGTSGLADQVLMPSDDDPDAPAPHAPEDQRFLPYLALLEGYVYDGDAIDGTPAEEGLKPHRHQKPLVLFPRPNADEADATERYMPAESGGLLGMLEYGWEVGRTWSARVRVDDDDGALWVEPSDSMRHALAHSDFTPLADDFENETMADFRYMVATLSVPWSFYAEAKYPAEAPFGQDVTRTLIVRAPFHRLDYVVPGTIVALDEKTGELLRTDTGGYIRDDREKLNQIARLAYEWYAPTRRAIGFSTSLVNNVLELGDLVVSIGDPEIAGNVHTEDVNSVITQIRIVMPLAEGDGAIGGVAPPIPRIEYETAFGELDVLQLVPRSRQR